MTQQPSAPPAAWYPDPGHPAFLRYWDGSSWTEHVAQAGAPATPPAWWRAYRPARALAVTSVVLCMGVAGIAVAMAAVAPAAAEEYERAVAAGQDLELVFTAYDAGGLVLFLALLLSWLVACVYLDRARQNAEALRPHAHHSRSRGWVWGGWLVPIVSFWFPYQVVRDIRDATSDAGRGGPVGLWWAACLTWLLGMNVASSATLDASLVSILPVAATVEAVAAVLAAMLWATVVLSVQTAQETIAAE